MAEGGEVHGDLSQQEVGCDFVTDQHCGRCRVNDKLVQGTSYCDDCRERLCNSCLATHSNSGASRQHNTRPVSESVGQRQCPTLDLEFCAQHPGVIVGFYCKAHNEVLCGNCKAIGHRECRDVKAITELCQGVKDSEETKEFAALNYQLDKILNDLRQRRERDSTYLHEQKRECLQKIKEFRKDINQLLDVLEEEMQQKVKDTAAKELKEIEEHLSCLDKVKESLGRVQKNFNTAKSLGSDQQMFTVLKKINVHDIENTLNAIENEQHIVKMTLRLPNWLPATLKEVTTRGHGRLWYYKPHWDSLSRQIFQNYPLEYLTAEADKLHSKRLPSILSVRSMEPAGDRSVQLLFERNCIITGSLILPNGNTLLCDYYSWKVKVLGPDLEVKADVKMKSGPWDLAMLGSGEVVVSLPDRQEIQYVALPDLAKDRTVKIGRKCYGVASLKDQLLVSCHNNPGDGEVLILTSTGKVAGRIGRNSNGGHVFVAPSYLATDPVTGKIYVSDSKRKLVTCLDKDGGTVFTHTDGDLRKPRKLLLDTLGNVFVCDGGSHSVHVVTPEGRKLRTLLTRADGIVDPYSICFRPRDRTLVVGMGDNFKVRVFRFL